jgi:hypothetical protein
MPFDTAFSVGMPLLGRAYARSLETLGSTYSWALAVPLCSLTKFVDASRGLPMLTVGSGGSLTSAIIAALLHQQTGMISQYLTPLEIISSNRILNQTSVIFVSAGGRNSDILVAFDVVVRKEPQELMVFCGAERSPLSTAARKHEYVHLCELGFLSGKDGFLAVNSILGFAVMLARAYEHLLPTQLNLPKTLASLVHPGRPRARFLQEIEREITSVLEKETIVVLHGNWGKPAAFDFESKFIEAGLSSVQLTDYRNFAHGRHNWLSKKGDRTGVLALITPDDSEIAERTLDLIPAEIPRTRLSADRSDIVGTLALLVKVLYSVDVAGQMMGVDPGRPQVPVFGRRIYALRMSAPRDKGSPLIQLSKLEQAAILRKISPQTVPAGNDNMIEFWINALHKFIRDLEEAHYGAIVFDYDGTLCDTAHRYVGAPAKIGRALTRLLESKAILGVATGRGKSARDDLRRIVPRTYWSQVFVGYYNCSDIGSLADNSHPNKKLKMDSSLRSFVSVWRRDRYLDKIAKYECRPKQITFEMGDSVSFDVLMPLLQSAIRKARVSTEVLESGHSIDILAPGVSKLDLVTMISRSGTLRAPVTLCIGDKGRWPGNDFVLLSGRYSLSVGTVSRDPGSCWNLAPQGHRGVQATFDYLSAIEFEAGTSGVMRFKHGRLGAGIERRSR